MFINHIIMEKNCFTTRALAKLLYKLVITYS